MSNEFKVGDVVWFVDNDRRQRRNGPEAVTVSKAGRKWVEYHDGRRRFDRETLLVDGGKYSSPGRIWRSVAEYEAHSDLQNAWSRFRTAASSAYGPAPEGVTKEDIDQAMRLLKLEK